MEISKKNVASVIVWIIGVLGGFGYFNKWLFIAWLVPLLFFLFGSDYTQRHVREYFNVIITTLLLSVLAFLVKWLLKSDIMYAVTAVYLTISSLLGLYDALRKRSFKAPLAFRLFR